MSQPKQVVQTTDEEHCFIAGRKFSKKVIHTDFFSISVPNMRLRPQQFVEEVFDNYSDNVDLDDLELNGDYTSPVAIAKIRDRLYHDLVDFIRIVMNSLMRTDGVYRYGILTDERDGWPLGTSEPVKLGPELTLPAFLDTFDLSIQEGKLEVLQSGNEEQDACIRAGYYVTFDMPIEITHKLKPLFVEYLQRRFSNYVSDFHLNRAYRKLVELTGWRDPGFQLFEECKHLRRKRDTVVVAGDRVLGVYTCEDCYTEFTSPIQSLA